MNHFNIRFLSLLSLNLFAAQAIAATQAVEIHTVPHQNHQIDDISNIAQESIPSAKQEELLLDLKVKHRNQLILDRQVSIISGKKSVFSNQQNSQHYVIEILAKNNQMSPNGQPSTYVELVVSEINKEGVSQIISKPSLYIFKNKTANITLTDKNNPNKNIDLSVKVK